jgi:hypothetical protein
VPCGDIAPVDTAVKADFFRRSALGRHRPKFLRPHWRLEENLGRRREMSDDFYRRDPMCGP